MTVKDANKIHIIAGPTASGKSQKALELAEQYDGVIINCDSMQIYDDLPILTAQPDENDLKQAPHLLYSHLHPNQPCSAGNWREIAEPLIHHVLHQGKTPIICGGSGLYIKALTNGLSPMPDVPDDIRAEAVALQKELGNPGFHDMLSKHDPIMAERFHPYHTARLVRAWEVLQATGKSLAEWQKLPRLMPPEDWEFEIHLVMPERSVLYNNCNQRFIKMFGIGALEEVEAFGKRIAGGDITDGVPLTKALGFRYLWSYMKGDMSKDDAIEKSQTETRQYAKRQTTWFRNQLFKKD